MCVICEYGPPIVAASSGPSSSRIVQLYDGNRADEDSADDLIADSYSSILNASDSRTAQHRFLNHLGTPEDDWCMLGE